MYRVMALESLRGLMALWVLVGHVLRHSGFGHGNPLGPLAPGYAVDVFIILSGFVIFYLLDRQRLSYRDFIYRRFLRLAPLFLVVLLVSLPQQSWQLDQLAALPWQTDKIQSSIVIRQDTLEHFWSHVVAHVTMLHGLLSDNVLPSSEYAFVGQAWSISVEWQFYLVAPVLFWLVVTRRWYALGAVVIGICAIRFTNYGGEGFAIRQAGFFMLGVLSYYAYRRLQKAKVDSTAIDGLALVAIAVIYLFLSKSLSLIIWAGVFALLIANLQEKKTLPQRIALAVFHHPILCWLGKVSYSIYMLHGLVIFGVSAAIFELAPDIDRTLFALTLLGGTVFATIVASSLTYRFVEQPGIALGQRFTAVRRTTPSVAGWG